MAVFLSKETSLYSSVVLGFFDWLLIRFRVYGLVAGLRLQQFSRKAQFTEEHLHNIEMRFLCFAIELVGGGYAHRYG